MRILLYAGKGGVGKTTLSAATGVWLAERGHRTLVMSLDVAHSLSDIFDVTTSLMDRHGGEPLQVASQLWIQELQIQEEIQKHWQAVSGYLSSLLNATGVDEVVADELAILPGMEEVSALLYINQYRREKAYDVVILDCAPTGESLRFVSLPTALDWYMNKLFRIERNLARVVRPIARTVTDIPLPGDAYFSNVQDLSEKLRGVSSLLSDPRATTVRLVTGAEKVVLAETQRALTYFSLYGLTVDAVIINRVLPEEAARGFFQHWGTSQERHARTARDLFSPVPVWEVPLRPDEVVGVEALREVAEPLYSSRDPRVVHFPHPPYRFTKHDGVVRLAVRLPFVAREEVEVLSTPEGLVLEVGGFRRHVVLPRRMAGMKARGARRVGPEVVITFGGRDEGNTSQRTARAESALG